MDYKYLEFLWQNHCTYWFGFSSEQAIGQLRSIQGRTNSDFRLRELACSQQRSDFVKAESLAVKAAEADYCL